MRNPDEPLPAAPWTLETAGVTRWADAPVPLDAALVEGFRVAGPLRYLLFPRGLLPQPPLQGGGKEPAGDQHIRHCEQTTRCR